MEDPFTVYLAMWEIFTSHALKKPNYFYNVFFSAIPQIANLNLFKEYYELYPEHRPTDSLISGMIEIDKTQDREAFVLNLCVKTGAIKSETVEYIRDIHLGYFKCILTDIVKSKLYSPSAELYHKYMTHFLYSMKNMTAEKYSKLIDDMIEFHLQERTGYTRFFS